MDHLNILYNIKAFFIGVLGVGLNTVLIITLLIEPLLVTSFMAFH